MDQKEKGIHLVLLLTNNGTFYIQRIKKRKKVYAEILLDETMAYQT